MRIETLDSNLRILASLYNGTLTLTDPLYLDYTPTQASHAVNKQYVDSSLSTINGGNITTGTFATSRLPAFTGGDVTSATGSTIFNLANTGVVLGSYTKITVNSKGLVTGTTNISNTDIPNLDWNKITTGKPTTLSGYGITDAISTSGGTVTGQLLLSNSPTASAHAVNRSYIVNVLNSSTLIRPGDIIEKPYSTTPSGFLKCNGAEVSKTTYSDLYAAIGDTFSNSYTMPGAGKPWKNQYSINTTQTGDITGWTTYGNLPDTLGSSQIVVTKNRIYALGGFNYNTLNNNTNVVYTAPINTDGTIGVWTTDTPLPSILQESQAIVTKNRVYLIGGDTNFTSSPVSAVYTAPINADGTLGTWTTGPSLPVATMLAQCVITKNRVYKLGGWTSIWVATSSVYSAPINTDGTLGGWVAENNLPIAIGNFASTVIGNYVYVLGGHKGSSADNTSDKIYSAHINSDGTLGSWVLVGTLPTGLCGHECVVVRNQIYILGGSNNVAVSSNNVYYATINPDGTIGTWTVGTSLPINLRLHGVCVTSNKIYSIGGLNTNSSNNTISTIYSASFSGGLNDYSPYYDGSITTTDPNSFKLPDFTSQDILKKVYHYIKY